jgi:glycerol-3-phosphate dehydrogenase (NAD(P)+)
MNVTVLGAGAWGTALARLAAQNQHAVTVWGHNANHLAEMQRTRRNERYLPGIDLPETLRFDADLRSALTGAECVVVAVPSSALRVLTAGLEHFAGHLVTATKGIEYDTGLTMSAVAQSNAPAARVSALSGPSLALEVARRVPTAVVTASRNPDAAAESQALFHRPSFRVYTSSDMIGVEMGGALKNVVAIGAGVCDGLGYGDNSKAALITRGIAEIRRLGVACGAQPDTFSGLSGLGDLTVTCFSRLSRNRGLGEKLGRGESLTSILEHSITVAEGCPTARSAFQLARKHGVRTPILDEVHAMLYEGKNAARAVRDLLERDSRAENDGSR